MGHRPWAREAQSFCPSVCKESDLSTVLMADAGAACEVIRRLWEAKGFSGSPSLPFWNQQSTTTTGEPLVEGLPPSLREASVLALFSSELCVKPKFSCGLYFLGILHLASELGLFSSREWTLSCCGLSPACGQFPLTRQCTVSMYKEFDCERLHGAAKKCIVKTAKSKTAGIVRTSCNPGQLVRWLSKLMDSSQPHRLLVAFASYNKVLHSSCSCGGG